MLLDQLIIRCPDVQDIEPLFQFLESEGVTWGSHDTPLCGIRINFRAYAERKRDVVCFSLEKGCLSYCRESWYRSNAPYYRYTFVDAQDLLNFAIEEETITGLTDLL